MMHILRRARRQPGPLMLATLTLLVVSTATVRAHDPGLSSLDVSVTDQTISVSLSLAAADVALASSDGQHDIHATLSQLAQSAIRLAVDDETLPLQVTDVMI